MSNISHDEVVVSVLGCLFDPGVKLVVFRSRDPPCAEYESVGKHIVFLGRILKSFDAFHDFFEFLSEALFVCHSLRAST